MTFLPIVERELRVASRRHYTYWSRLVAAAFMLLIFGAILGTMSAARGMPWSIGQVEFTALKWLAFAFACSTGVYLTSDSLSEEKRDGTIGLLFLTDLRGYDVVLGKLLSSSLQAFYGLLAAFPILALPLMMGGVTGVEFGQAMLVIGNTLFLSLAIGMFVSAISREAVKAMNGVVFLMLILLLILPWMDLAMAGTTAKFKPILSCASPGYLFVKADRMMPGEFWFDLALQHFLGWVMLALACFVIPRAWQEKNSNPKDPRQSVANWLRFGGKRARAVRRRKLLDQNPVLWLALRDRWMARLIWLAMAAVAAISSWQVYRRGNNGALNLGNSVQIIFVLLLLLWISAQASRLFVDAVRNGAMELVLVTPINPRQIVDGQWRALWRTFLLPALFVILLYLLPLVETLMTAKPPVAVPAGGYQTVSQLQYQIISAGCGIINSLTMFLALSWFGMWMGLTSRKTTLAVLKTFFFVCVLPWIAELFIQIFTQVLGTMMMVRIFGPSFAGKWPFWTSTIVASLFEVGKNILFITWSRRRLLNHFRDAATRGGQSSPSLPTQLEERVGERRSVIKICVIL